MNAIERRLEEMEARLVPLFPREAMYYELPCRGVYRRIGTDRLVLGEQLAADAAGADSIVVVYQAGSAPPKLAGWIGVGPNVIMLPDNHRGDQEGV